MNNPRPVPEKDFEVNLENNFGKRSESMPDPLSLILTYSATNISRVPPRTVAVSQSQSD
jgi:hypothetical protein